MAFRERVARPRHSIGRWPSAASGSMSPCSSTSPRKTSSRGWPAAGSARPTATSTTSLEPARVAGICDLDGSDLVQREDDREETVRARMAQQIAPLREVVDHYRATGVLRTIDGAPPDRRGDGRSAGRDGPRARGGLIVVTRKSRSEIERMRQAGRIVAEVLDKIEAELRPGVSAADLDAMAEAHIRDAGAVPSFKGYPGINPQRPFPASVCISIDDEIVHGIPGVADDPGRPDRLGRCRRDRRRLARRRRADILHRRAAATGPRADRPDPRRDARRASPPPSPATTSTTSRPPSRTWPGRAGLGIIRQFVGHGIGTDDARGAAGARTTGRGARAASSSPGSASRSSRCSRSASTTRGSSATTGRSSPRTAPWPRISSIRSPSPRMARRS